MSAGCPDDERLARITLSRIWEPGDPHVAKALAVHGPCDLVAGLRSGSLRFDGSGALRSRLAVAHPEQDLRAAERIGARFVCPGDAEWPEPLDDLRDYERPKRDGGPSVGLWVRGGHDLAAATVRSVAIVGSRASTGYGNYVASELGTGLATRRWTVVSGAAYGVDAAAHRGSFAGDGVTVAVVACGIDVVYPRAHAALYERLVAEGLIVSEWPVGCSPMRYRFLVRNRLIAALTAGTVVVEAAARSGAINTAGHARDLARHVMAVPGPVTSGMSEGCNALLREPDVTCVRGPADVVELVGRMGEAFGDDPEHPTDARDSLDLLTRRVLDAVPLRNGAGVASIALAAGVEQREVVRCLGALFAGGFIERTDAGWRVTPPP